MLTAKELRSISIAQVIKGLSEGQSVDGLLREVGQQLARDRVIEAFDPWRPAIPWELLGRDLVVRTTDPRVGNGIVERPVERLGGFIGRDVAVGTSSAGGYLLQTDVASPVDILRGFSITASAGLTVIPGVGNVSIPKITTPPTTQALSNEQATTAESTAAPVFGATALQPKNLATYFEVSRQLLKQSAYADRFLATVALGAVAQYLDKQVLGGVGSNGELMGLMNLANVQVQSRTSLGLDGVTAMAQKCTEAGALDGELAFISTPAIRQLLQKREKTTGNGGFIWQGGRVVDLPAYASNDCGSASMVVGPWPRCIVSIWGVPTVEMNAYTPVTNYQAGMIGVRLIVSADMAPISASSFCKSTSIT